MRQLQRRFLRKRGAVVGVLALSVIAARCQIPPFGYTGKFATAAKAVPLGKVA